MNIAKDYDGFYFQPNDEGVEFNYFKYNEEKDRGAKVDNNDMGDKYHIILWKSGEDGLPYIDDNYEAILIAPVEYAQHLSSCTIPMYGVIVRKTTESFKFVDSYLAKFEESVKKAINAINKMKK